jgi:hypothetical protein
MLINFAVKKSLPVSVLVNDKYFKMNERWTLCFLIFKIENPSEDD